MGETRMSSDAIAQLEPQNVWQLFAEIARVPRASKHEEQICAHLRAQAQQHGFEVDADAVGNLVIRVPATAGCEKAPTVVLQGHVDMVCEKNAGTQHDFDRDPIELVRGTDARTGVPVVHARGTTLGADNGMGVALAFAAASDPAVPHGPLELLLTIDEEMGMTGAEALAPGFFKGQIFINLDSEEDDILYIGCAGGGDTSLTWTLPTTALAAGATVVRVTVYGFRGGHSGGNIHENRGNALQTLIRTLHASGITPLRIVHLAGGSKRNALAREAHADVAIPADALAKLQTAAQQVCKLVRHEAAEEKAAIDVQAAPADAAKVALSAADSQRVLDTLLALPHGVLEMHPRVAGLVQTSNNVATAATTADTKGLKIEVGTLSRSSVDSRLDATRQQIAAVGRLAGADVAFGNAYPGWEPNIDSPLLATCRNIYERLFGEAPKVTAIHAGLECGLIGRKIGGLDMISFGPRITGAHSPDEQVFVESVAKSYRYLQAVLAELAQR